MTCSLAVSWDDRLTSYDFGPGHPLAPVRVELTMALAREFGLLDAPGVSMITPAAAPPELLELVHDDVYLAAVERHPKAGICLDTCHMFAAGHDLTAAGGVAAMLDELVTAAGPGRVGLVHANDSLLGCGSKRDRHEEIGRASCRERV